MNKKNQGLASVSGILFLVSAVIYIFCTYVNMGLAKHPEYLRMSYSSFFPAVFMVIAAIGILVDQKTVAGAGFAMCAAVMTNSALNPFFYSFDLVNVLMYTPPAIAVYCACIAAFSDRSKVLYCVSGAITLFELIYRISGNFKTTIVIERLIPDLISGNIVKIASSMNYIGMLLAGVGFILLFAASMPPKQRIAMAAAPGMVNAPAGKIERLTTLKALLDQGVISPEDFERKKQEIIGQ